MFNGKKILLIGGTGSIGQALLNEILKHSPSVVRVFSRDEYKQFKLMENMAGVNNIRYLLGDIRDKERLNRAMQDIDIVFNLAALKHVPACEYNPFEAVKTNVMGTQNVIECALENKVQKVIYTSSDKAVSPTNTMGATKLLAERLMSSANFSRGENSTVFASVRFGNVIGSRGSVIPLFKKQIQENKYITITEPEMTRFMMTKSQAVNLILKAYQLSQGGEVFVLKMPVIRLTDLGDVVITKTCLKAGISSDVIKKKVLGLRPGEKMFEELMSEDEAVNAIELEDMYIISSLYGARHVYNGVGEVDHNSYNSKYQKPIDKIQIEKMLEAEELI